MSLDANECLSCVDSASSQIPIINDKNMGIKIGLFGNDIERNECISTGEAMPSKDIIFGNIDSTVLFSTLFPVASTGRQMASKAFFNLLSMLNIFRC